MSRFAFFAATVLAGAAAAEPTIAEAWAARGAQAVEKLKAINPRMPTRPALRSRKDEYAALLEASFQAHAKSPKTVQLADGTAFLLVLKSRAGDLFEGRYTYPKGAKGADKPTSFSVDKLPKGWRVIASAGEAASVAVQPEPGVQLKFPTGEPLTASVDAQLYTAIREGGGAQPAATDTVVVHYRALLRDGTEFDSTYKSREAAEMPLTGIIPCWTENIPKMKVGGKARLICPSESAYGEAGSPPWVPPHAEVTFEIELIGVKGK